MNDRIDTLINDNLNLVHFLIKHVGANKKYRDYEDLFAQGRLGLVQAANEYDEGRGVKFSTFASKLIKKEIVGFCDANYLPLDSNNVPVEIDRDDDRMTILVEAIDCLPIRDQNILLGYFSNTKDTSAILNRILSERKAFEIVEELKKDIGII